MKKLNIIFVFIFAVGLQQLSAQVPGYQGKRFAVGYNASSFFYFDQGWEIGDGIDGLIGSTRLSYKTEAYVNYTVSRKVTMGFSYYTAKQNYSFTKNEIQGYGYFSPADGIAQCRLSIYELHFQFFRKNFIAPVGLYNQFSFAIVNYKLATHDNTLTVYDNNNNKLIIDGPLDPYACYKLGYAIGKTNPIGHNFYINTAFGINFFRAGDSPYIKTTLNLQNYTLANFNRNLRTHNFLEIKIGFGWLAF